jgi:chemotaxis signal transduction protein
MVHVQDPRLRWSVHASRVLRIVGAAERGDAVAIDVVAALGGTSTLRPTARRVVVVRGAGGRELALLAVGPIDVGEIETADVLALPPQLASSPLVAAIVVRGGSLSLLVEPNALIAPEDTVTGEELCPNRS